MYQVLNEALNCTKVKVEDQKAVRQDVLTETTLNQAIENVMPPAEYTYKPARIGQPTTSLLHVFGESIHGAQIVKALLLPIGMRRGEESSQVNNP